MTTKQHKKRVRQQFREAVFERDDYRCVVCGFKSSPEHVEHQLDAHHITPREEMPNGGYVKENGISLCDPSKTGGARELGCHYKAEQFLQRIAQGDAPSESEYSPEALYKAIGSSPEEALRAAERDEP